MRYVRRSQQAQANGVLEQTWDGGSGAYEMIDGLSGYILEPSSIPASPGRIRAWGYMVVVTGTLGEPEAGMATAVQSPLETAPHKRLALRPVGRLVPVTALQRVATTQAEPKAIEASSAVHTLRPVRSGQAYRIASPPARGLVRPELAEALETVFERFAQERGFSSGNPLAICLAHGFKPGSHGHGEGRAADIGAVGGKGLLAWKREWDQAMAAAEKLSDPQHQVKAISAEKERNLGYGLYKALQKHGGWRVNKGSWRPYQGVLQLFGPWTATEGPWKATQIKDPTPYQCRRLADQQWVFQAHQDHVHVAR